MATAGVFDVPTNEDDDGKETVVFEMISIVVVTLRQQHRIQTPASSERFVPSLAVSNDASPL